ncbi:MAG: helicase C-terminal domain-containing protein [Candidatus Nitrosopolaris sp.]
MQTQYARDFPFVKVAKGKNNFTCAVKNDFIINGTYKCGSCVSNNAKECYHKTADYGPCMSDINFRNSSCKYRTFPEHYKIRNKGTREEKVFLDHDTKNHYQKEYSEWSYLKNLSYHLRSWMPCEYYHQLNIASAASHSILNYSNFLAFLTDSKVLPSRELLILDEAHLLESEIVKFRGISISKRKWKQYIPNLKMVDYGYDDIEKWIDFLINLERRMLDFTWHGFNAEMLPHLRRDRIGKSSNEKTVRASDLFESDKEIAEKYFSDRPSYFGKEFGRELTDELAVEVIRDIQRLERAKENILSDPKNWMVSEIKKEGYEVTGVEFKPLDTSAFCNDVFGKCSKTLMMTATVLDSKAFCQSLGLAHDEVKFIQVGSDFPLQNRPIYPLNIAYLNFKNLQLPEVKTNIAIAIDNLMTTHKNHKGLIHTTSYEQLNFIKENISQSNKRRLLVTDPEIQRDEVISEHVNSTKPTVLISPSLHTGLDLKDDLSRFQIITKVPYPNISDRWTDAKRNANGQWYTWQTALRLVQGYGRSIRSKEDWAKTYVGGFGVWILCQEE